MLADPDELDRLATVLDREVARIRHESDEHARQAGAAHWVSASAQRYRELIVQERAHGNALADELAGAAHLLRLHATEIRQRLAIIATAEEKALKWFIDGSRGVVVAAAEALDAL